MKNNFTTALAVSLVLLLTESCCTKQECVSVNSISHITMRGFSPEETDTVVLESFPAGSGFSQHIDSTLLFPGGMDEANKEVYLPLTSSFASDQDYRFTLSGQGLVYTVTGIELKQVTCNKCVGTSDKYPLLKSYFVNGKKTVSNVISISR